MNEQVTRQILWNIPVPFIVLMYGLLALLIVGFVYAGLRWYRLVSLGVADDRLDHPVERLLLSLRDSFGQGNVIRETWGWMHYAFYVAFVGLFIGTTIVAINSDVRDLFDAFGLDLYFYYGDFYLYFKAAMDTFFLLLILGVLMEGMRRAVRKPTVLNEPPVDKMRDNLENRLGYWFPMSMMVLIAVTGLMLEGARINASHPAFHEWAYVGRVVGRMEGALGAGVTYHRWLWLVHVLLRVRAAVLFSIHQAAPFDFRPAESFLPQHGSARTARADQGFRKRGDLRRLAGRAVHLEATARHGLVPRMRPLHDQLPDSQHRQDAQSQVSRDRTARASARQGAVPARRESPRHNGDAAGAEAPAWNGPDMITQVATEEAVWGCTTCGWCEEGCPVGIEHIQRIVDMRRYDVLMESRFPTELTGAFKGIENQGNPWGLAQEKRAEWANGLDIPEIAELEDPSEIDVLYWVGCAGSYDERNQRVSKSFSGLMKQAGVKFAILGREETCTGDPARRLGNEYLYATVAAQNVETLNRYKPRRIVTQCPHCFHNLKNEYPDFGGNYTVLHEAEFIDELIQAGRLKPRGKIAERITYHDPCYMARHNRKWDSARSALGAIPGAELEEVEQSKNRTFCCGAGGGCFWKEEHEGTRINQKRFDQLQEAKPKCVAVGCPFCMTMLEDAVKSRSLEETMRVRDLAELVAESTGVSTK